MHYGYGDTPSQQPFVYRKFTSLKIGLFEQRIVIYHLSWVKRALYRQSRLAVWSSWSEKGIVVQALVYCLSNGSHIDLILS